MHAYIITGGSADERSERITILLKERSVSSHDTITITPEGASIGIDSVRPVFRLLSVHAVASPGRAAIVRDANTMTTQAQNAFLKTLEEPPGDALIILETNQPDALLPTILSRCQLVNLGGVSAYTHQEIRQCIDTVTRLEEASVGRRWQIIDTLAKTKDEALAFVNLALVALHNELNDHGVDSKLPRRERVMLLRRFLDTRNQLLGNVNPKLAIDAVFL